ncbi:MAG: hypothetical protein ABI700_20820 [Chloroflexota bacterium]
MAAKQAKNAVGLMFEVETGLTALQETGLEAQDATRLKPVPRTTRPYKKRARKCACGCGKAVAPTARNPNKRFFDDNCRKRWHRQQEAKMRKDQPATEKVLEMYTCQFCGATFLAEAGRGAKWCKPSHGVMAAEHRRAAAARVFVESFNMTPEDTENMIERVGMKNVSAYLRQQKWVYDEQARRWGIAVQAGDVFAGKGGG